jgi:penicillin-binding protein 2
MRKKEGVHWTALPWDERHHALFVGYAPPSDPTLLVCVVVEHGGDAATVAAPIAARIFLRAFGPHAGEGGVTATAPTIYQNVSLPPASSPEPTPPAAPASSAAARVSEHTPHAPPPKTAPQVGVSAGAAVVGAQRGGATSPRTTP